MKKSEAIELLGGTVSAAAKACRISGPAVSQWPEELSEAIEDRVLAALHRKNFLGRETGTLVAPIPSAPSGPTGAPVTENGAPA